MRSEIIQETQELANTAPAALAFLLGQRAQLLAEIEALQSNSLQPGRLANLQKQLRDINLTIGEVRTFLLGVHRSIEHTQTLLQKSGSEYSADSPQPVNKKKQVIVYIAPES